MSEQNDASPPGGTVTDVIEFDHHGHPALRLTSGDGASATVLLHGAHVVSWMPTPGDERLYMSPTSRFGDGEAVRGGVPVIFPRFALTSTNAEVPRHGFVRTQAWQRVARTATPDSSAVGATSTQSWPILECFDDARSRTLWPHRFRLSLALELSPSRLAMTLVVRNEGTTTFDFTAALHTYLAIDDITRIAIDGLQHHDYFDKVNDAQSSGDAGELRFTGEVDRIYRAVRQPILLRDGPRTLAIEQHGFKDAVVWNPWAGRCAELPDMPDEDYQRMVCIEAAQVVEPARLAPGEHWHGTQRMMAG